MSAVPPFPAPGPRALPFPSWPVWLVFGVLLVPGIVLLGLFGLSQDSAADELAFQRDVVGRSVVLTGALSDVDTTSGLPKTSSYYDVTIPATGDGAVAGGSVTFSGGEQWGFPPSSEYPAELDFLVVLDDPPRAVQHGPVGSIQPVTEQTVQDAQSRLAQAHAIWVAGIVVFWLFALGLPALAIVLAVRRRRAKGRIAVPARL